MIRTNIIRFPINATRQVNRATKTLQHNWNKPPNPAASRGMPPVLACQSVVDSTVGPYGVADLLYPRLRGPQHRLVLFDVNRHDALGSVQRPAAGALIDRLAQQGRGYTLDVVTNTSSKDRRVSVRRLTPGGGLSVRHTAMEWPGNVGFCRSRRTALSAG